MPRGKYIIFDGPDKSGKSTQIELLKPLLEKAGVRIEYTKEPGGIHPANRAIMAREWLLSNQFPRSTPLSDFFLFFAARADLFEKAIRPFLDQGVNFIQDRGDPATYAFQIFGEDRKKLDDLFVNARRAVYEECKPDCYILFDLPAEVILERMRADPKIEKTHFDMRSLEFHTRVRKGYETFAKRFEGTQDQPVPQILMVDANRSREEVHADISKIVRHVLKI